tara:strand:- start:282 stop:1364 length:1083 start_codon:yes stop_codon:yes gene_type:complete
MADETPKRTRPWYSVRESYEWRGRNGHKNAKFYYKQAVTELEKLQSRLSAIYKNPNIADRQYELKKLETELGTRDFAGVVKRLREQKDYTYKILSSKYVDARGTENYVFHNDGRIPLSSTSKYIKDYSMIIGNNMNPYYDPFYDFDSKETLATIEKAGITKEDYINQWTNVHGFPEDALQFLDPKNKDAYVDPSDNTDLWGREISDADFGINPAIIAATKKKNFKLPAEFPGTIDEFNEAYGLKQVNPENYKTKTEFQGTEEEFNKKYADYLPTSDDVTNNKNIEEVTPNREDLMSKRFKERAAEIEAKPSRIQEGLLKSGFTTDRLAKLSIKDQDFQKAKGNKKLMIKFKEDKAAGVYR